MKALIWKLRYTIYFSRKVDVEFRFAWDSAESWIESYGLDECGPIDAAEEEIEAWRQSQ